MDCPRSVRHATAFVGVVKMLKAFCKSSALKLSALFAALMVVLHPARVMAEVPADVTTALSGAKVDATTVATAVLVVIVAIFAFKLMRKAL